METENTTENLTSFSLKFQTSVVTMQLVSPKIVKMPFYSYETFTKLLYENISDTTYRQIEPSAITRIIFPVVLKFIAFSMNKSNLVKIVILYIEPSVCALAIHCILFCGRGNKVRWPYML